MLLKTLARTTLIAVVVLAASTGRAEEQAVLLHSAPAKAEANKALRLEGTLVDDARRISELIVRYRGPGEPYAEMSLERQYGDLYRGTIPAEHMVPPGVEYYVEGVLKAGGGERVPVFQSAARPARVIVAGEIPGPRWPTWTTPSPRLPRHLLRPRRRGRRACPMMPWPRSPLTPPRTSLLPRRRLAPAPASTDASPLRPRHPRLPPRP